MLPGLMSRWITPTSPATFPLQYIAQRSARLQARERVERPRFKPRGAAADHVRDVVEERAHQSGVWCRFDEAELSGNAG